MKGIGAKISELTALYKEQLALYEKMKTIGRQEKQLIENGRLDQLLGVLEKKHSLLTKAASQEEQLQKLQQTLIGHFQINEFSVPQLQKAASLHYQEDLGLLGAVLTDLVPLLESLEEQEKQNEHLLHKYITRTKNLLKDPSKVTRATKAYGIKDPKDERLA